MSTKEIPFGKIKENKIFLSSWGGNPERPIGEIRESEDESIQYFVDRFKELTDKIDKLESDVNDSQNKGSFLMKILHMKEMLLTHDGLGDYLPLRSKLENLESLLSDIIQKNRDKNTEIKQALIEELKVSVDKINWKEATQEIHDLKSRWIKTGSAREDVQEDLNAEFWGFIDAFFEKKKQFYEDKKLLSEKSKKEYLALIDKASDIANKVGKEKFDLINRLKEEWRNVSNIPKEEYDPLFAEFNKKLKAKPAKSLQKEPHLDINKILSDLESYVDGKEKSNFKNLATIKEKLKLYKPKAPDERQKRKLAFQHLQLLSEQNFLDKLVLRRFSNFNELEKDKKRQIRLRILEDLISRDRADLDTYTANSEKFNTNSQGMLDIVEKKIQQQKEKIIVKEMLLKRIKGS